VIASIEESTVIERILEHLSGDGERSILHIRAARRPSAIA
jgi:hypothetical protein